VVLDVGAHIGYYTLLMSDLVGCNGKVFAFEPEPSNFNLLQKNVEINTCKNIVIEKKAVSDYNKKSYLYLSKDNSGMHRLNNSVYCKQCIAVDVISLDDYFCSSPLIDKIRFVKIDVEGSELDVLSGMKLILEKNHNIAILLEFIPDNLAEHGSNPIDLLRFFKDNSFKIYAIIDGVKSEVYESDFKNMFSYDGKSLLCIKNLINGDFK
ncbi:MAG: FkbM family methyltransferase, partial [Nanoarchaeota archaeon]